MPTYLIQETPGPTADFYFPDRDLQYDITLKNNPNTYSFDAKDTLIFVRYITKEWLDYLKKNNSSKKPNLVLFIDDDVFDIQMHVGLPWRYRWKLYQLSARHKKQLKQQGFKLWVSTPWLANKYADWQPIQRSVRNPYKQESCSKDIVFYHGTASHHAEIEWLFPIFEKVISANKQLNIELIGNEKTRRLFKDMNAVHVYYPMSWYSYRELIRSPGRIIGLAPLVETPFNQARSASKFFDITQAGAVGLYADSPVYAEKVIHGETGFLLPMEREMWIEHILRLTESPLLRAEIWRNARQSINF